MEQGLPRQAGEADMIWYFLIGWAALTIITVVPVTRLLKSEEGEEQ